MLISVPPRAGTFEQLWEFVRSTICDYLDGLRVKYQLMVYKTVTSNNKFASFIAADCIIHVYKIPVLYDNEYDIELQCKSECNYGDDLKHIFTPIACVPGESHFEDLL